MWGLSKFFLWKIPPEQNIFICIYIYYIFFKLVNINSSLWLNPHIIVVECNNSTAVKKNCFVVWLCMFPLSVIWTWAVKSNCWFVAYADRCRFFTSSLHYQGCKFVTFRWKFSSWHQSCRCVKKKVRGAGSNHKGCNINIKTYLDYLPLRANAWRSSVWNAYVPVE